MRMRTRTLAGLVLVGVLTPGSVAAHEPASVRAHGDALLLEGDAYRAIGAYKEYLHLAPDPADGDVVRYRIALAYFMGEQWEAALFASNLRGRPEVRQAGVLLGGAALYRDGQYERVAAHLEAAQHGYARYLTGWSWVKQWSFEAAALAFDAVPADSVWRTSAQALADELSRPVEVSHRSPWLAGILSIVPGLGHVYLGMFGVSVSALLWNGAFGWGLYETVRARQWGLFALLAVLESVWYFGTIYGAVSGAQRHNRDAVLNYVEALEARHAPPGPPPQPDLPGTPPIAVRLGARF